MCTCQAAPARMWRARPPKKRLPLERTKTAGGGHRGGHRWGGWVAGGKKLGGVENRAAWWGKWGHGGRAATKRVKTGGRRKSKDWQVRSSRRCAENPAPAQNESWAGAPK